MYTRLSVMMFLEFFIWGAWFVTMGTYLTGPLGFSDGENALAYATQSWGAIIAPFVIGLLGGLVLAITSRSRASELGVYRLSGLTRIQLVTLLGAEQALISGFWLNSAAAATLVARWAIDLPLLASLGYQMWGIAAMTALSFVVAAATASRNVTDLLKDR